MDVISSPPSEGNTEYGEMNTEFADDSTNHTAREKAKKNDGSRVYFTVDRSFIPTVLENEQERELSMLDIKVYDQNVLEQGILHQVSRALDTNIKESSQIPLHIDKKFSNESCDTGDQSERDFTGSPITISEEQEKKINIGEIKPLETVISLRVIEGNNLDNIESYLKKQIEMSSKQKALKGKSKLTENKTKIHRQINKKAREKKLKCKPVTEFSMVGRHIESPASKDINESDCNHSTGSEYVPTEPDSDDSNYSVKSKSKSFTKKKRKLKEKEVLVNDINSKSEKNKYYKDDGDRNYYIERLEDWEKKNFSNVSDIEFRVIDDGFKIPLKVWNAIYNYQRAGVQWLWELNSQRCGGILGDEMGLGKTIQIIAFLTGLKVSQQISRHGSFRGLGPVLIICPTTVMHQWVKEFHKWWPPFRVALLHESGTFNGRKNDLIREIVSGNGLLITSYVTCIQQSNNLLRHTWHYVILDEGHKIRNPESQIAKTVKLFNTPHRLILSGSPMQNNLKELWSLFDFIFPGKLGSLPVFMAEFGVPITQGGYANASKIQVATAFKCATVLRDTISPYLLRRAKEDIKNYINLPPKNEQVLFCRLTQEQKDLYIHYLNSGRLAEILNGRLKVFVGLIELRKICNHPDIFTGGPKRGKWVNSKVPLEEQFGYWKRAGKMIVVETLLKIWKKQGHRVLIFTQSRKMLQILESFIRIQEYEYIKMDGATTIGSRQPLISKFNENKKYYIFLSTTHVGGLGVNLTGANRVIIYDPDWNPATDTQARERAWRIGQEQQVTIYRLVTSGTIEEKIYHRQIFKQFLTNKVLKDPSQRRFFKTNDLYELFTYKDDENANETSAIFAGTNYEVSLKNLQNQNKTKFETNISLEPTSINEIVQTQRILSREKIEKMKQMAQELSRRIGLAAQSEESTKTIDNKMASETRFLNKLSENLVPKTIQSENSKLDTCDTQRSNKKRKSKRKRSDCTDFDDIVHIPHLKKQRPYRDVVKGASDGKDDCYILKKLFSKSGVQSALRHDEIMKSDSIDYALVEAEAEKIAKEAVKALKESRRQYMQSVNEHQTNSTLLKPRFGKKSLHSQNISLTSSGEKNNSNYMSSAELLQRIRQRNGLCPVVSNIPDDPLNMHSDLLADIRNFISFGTERNGKATTQEIINRFRERLPKAHTPLFKALLNEICDFHRTPDGEGVWELRSDFQW